MKRIVCLSSLAVFVLSLTLGCEKKVETPKTKIDATPDAVTVDKEKGKVVLPAPPKE